MAKGVGAREFEGVISTSGPVQRAHTNLWTSSDLECRPMLESRNNSKMKWTTETTTDSNHRYITDTTPSLFNLLTDLRILAPTALVLELVLDVITVAAADHGQLGMCQPGFLGEHFPDGPVTVPYVVNKPGGGVAHFMDQRVSQTVYKQLSTTLRSL